MHPSQFDFLYKMCLLPRSYCQCAPLTVVNERAMRLLTFIVVLQNHIWVGMIIFVITFRNEI